VDDDGRSRELSGESPYRGQRVALVTQHGKDAVLGPVLDEHVGVRVERVDGFDTDTLGTFTREVPRAGTQREAARRKAQLGLERAGLPLALGSEGAFGPSPLGWGSWDVEVLVWLDATRGLEVVGRAQGPGQHAHATVSSWPELVAFAARAGFPDHALVLRPDDDAGMPLHKGLATEASLRSAWDDARRRSRSGAVFAENDLRAHMNPTRLGVIAAAGLDLAQRLRCACPRCASPGFGVAARRPGLPCRDCGTPTSSWRAERWSCVACDFSEERAVTPGASADPGTCPQCNP
jgi:hypothetical protein